MHAESLSDQFSSEFSLLLALTSPMLAQKQGKEVIQKLNECDLNELFLLAKSHRVHLLLCKTLTEKYKNLIPPPSFQQFDMQLLLSSIRNLTLFNEMYSIIELLKKSGILIIPFKGPVLAQHVYGNINLRAFGDIDILIEQKDIEQTFTILTSLGFTLTPEIHKDCLINYLKSEACLYFSRTNDGLKIDLQSDLTNKYALVPYSCEAIKQTTLQHTISGKAFQGLSHEDTLINLCVHSASHSWQMLEYITSTAHHITKNQINWHEVIRRAKQLKVIRMVSLGLNLCRLLYKVEIPAIISSHLLIDSGVKNLSLKICEKLDTPRHRSAVPERFDNIHIVIRDSFADRLHYILRLLFRPTVKEWQHYPQLADYYQTYSLLRPFRLAATFLSDALKKK